MPGLVAVLAGGALTNEVVPDLGGTGIHSHIGC